jgi:hypothetical protein
MDEGYIVCECGKFAFVYSAEILRQLPKDYRGELCQDCKFWMCNIKYLPKENEVKEGFCDTCDPLEHPKCNKCVGC